jgi:protein phosphatase
VAIFRGVNTDFGPLKFYKVASNTPIKMTDLTPVAQSQVESGITAHSQSGAQQIVGNLLTQLLPPCPTATPTPTVTQSVPHSSPTHARSSASTSAPPSTPSASPSPTTSQPREGCR